jgi:hypothetical protein
MYSHKANVKTVVLRRERRARGVSTRILAWYILLVELPLSENIITPGCLYSQEYSKALIGAKSIASTIS